MPVSICRQKIIDKRLCTAIVIFWPFLFSCKAQTSALPVFEPAQGSPVVMTCSPGNILAGDVNNDSKPDLVVACGQEHRITILTGRGNGQFDTIPGSSFLLSFAPNEIVIGDMNRDGNADLAIGSHDSYDIMIFVGDGKGHFTVSPGSTVTMKQGKDPHTHGLGISDLNGDGYPDIVTANSSDNDISVMLNNGNGGFMPASGSPFSVAPSPYPLTIGEVNNDTHLDILSTSTEASSRALTVLSGDGKGGFRRNDIPLRTVKPWYVAIGDINKDRIPDMVMTHSERRELTVLLGTGGGQFTEVTGSPYDLGSNAWHVALADINHDGNPDVLAAANNGIRAMFGDGAGRFVSAPGSPFATGKGTWHLAVSDLNGDGKPDVVTSNLESNNVSVLLGK